jgi:hypothetical protein
VEPWMWSGARRLTEHDQEKKDEKRKKIRWTRVTRAVARRRTMGDAIPRQAASGRGPSAALHGPPQVNSLAEACR